MFDLISNHVQLVVSLLMILYGMFLIIVNYLCFFGFIKSSMLPLIGGTFCCLGILLFPVPDSMPFLAGVKYFCWIPFLIDFINIMFFWVLLILLGSLLLRADFSHALDRFYCSYFIRLGLLKKDDTVAEKSPNDISHPSSVNDPSQENEYADSLAPRQSVEKEGDDVKSNH